MKKPWFNKETLLTTLLAASIITVVLIGLYVLMLLTSGTLVVIFNAINAVLIPFVIAFFLSFIVGPISRWLEKLLHLNKNLAIVLAILIGLVFIIVVLGVAIYFIVTQLSSILSSLILLVNNAGLEQLLNQVIDAISSYVSGSDLSSIITEMAENGISISSILVLFGSLFAGLSRFASSLIGVLMVFVLTPVFLFYLIKEKALIFESLSKVAPKAIRHHVVELGKRSDIVIQNYFKGQGLMMLIIFIFFSITLGGLSFFIPGFLLYYAIVFALLMGLFSIIPYLGAWLGLLAPVVFLFTQHLELQQSGSDIYIIGIIFVIAFQVIEQVLESSLIQPYVFGKQVHIHPLLVLSAFIFFGGLFGLAGVLLAVPLAGTIKTTVEYIGEIQVKSKPKPSKSN